MITLAKTSRGINKPVTNLIIMGNKMSSSYIFSSKKIYKIIARIIIGIKRHLLLLTFLNILNHIGIDRVLPKKKHAFKATMNLYKYK